MHLSHITVTAVEKLKRAAKSCYLVSPSSLGHELPLLACIYPLNGYYSLPGSDRVKS